MAAVGPLLTHVVHHMRAPEGKPVSGTAMAVADVGDADDIAVVIRLRHRPPRARASWAEHRESILAELTALQHALDLPCESTVLIAGRSLQVRLTPSQIADLLKREAGVAVVELDPIMQLTLLDQVPTDVELAAYVAAHPGIDGSGVTVAVLDSGIDRQHPALTVPDGVSVCDESIALPGDHGTHCAGSIASHDSVFRGMAPGVKLIDIKVLHSNGVGKPGDIARGVDAALDHGADILSMSLGSNHFPIDFFGGNGWACPDGHCQLCMAVDNAAVQDGTLSIVAAGNDHARAESLRDQKRGGELDTELSCPGQARQALTVGAIAKQTWAPGDFSSRGTTAYGAPKPDIAAPGVNITSSITVPRDATGNPKPDVPRAQIFASKSGTSMATPIVAGLAALVAQELATENGRKPTPAEIRTRLLATAALLGSDQENITGAGRARAT